jgi:succinoglycan biosynthesis protein ExoV
MHGNRDMNICRPRSRALDVGGLINDWLWPRLLPDHCARDDGTLLLGTGGLIDAATADLATHRRVVVFGAGVRGRTSLPDMTRAEWDIRFVRGPESARALGLAPEGWLCDPAVLASKLHGGRGRERLMRAGSRRIGLIPGRHATPEAALTLADGAGLHLIDAHDHAESWLNSLIDCDAAICGDLIAAVIADAYGIPWRPLRSAYADDGFEWLDWSRSMGLTPCPVDIQRLSWPWPASADDPTGDVAMRCAIVDLAEAARSDRWSLSDRALLRLRQQALAEELSDLHVQETTPRRHQRLVGRGA